MPLTREGATSQLVMLWPQDRRFKTAFCISTIVSELALCIPSDGIKLQSGVGHYSGCCSLQTCRTQ